MERKHLNISKQFSLDLLEYLPNPILIINDDTSINYVNPALEGLTGFTFDEIIGKFPPYPWWSEQSLLANMTNVHEIIAPRKGNNIEVFQKKNGKKFWVQVNSLPFSSNGRKYYLSNWVNVTERKHTEELVYESQERLKQFFENDPAYCYVISPNGIMLDINKSALEALGYSKKQLLGKPHEIIYTPQFTARIHKAFEIKNRRIVRLRNAETVVVAKKGKKYNVLVSVAPVQNADGDLLHFVVVQRDITESKKVNMDLQDSQEFSSGLLHNAPHPILVINKDTSIRYVNPSLEEITGYSLQELVGRKFPYPWWTKQTEIQSRNRLLKALKQGKNKVEVIFQNRDKQKLYVEISTLPVRKNRKFDYFVSNWVDISERKMNEERLRKSREELRNLSLHIESVRESERERISRELHDELGQILTALKMDLFWISEHLENRQIDIKNRTISMLKMMDSTLQTVKRIYTELRPRVLDELGLVAAMEWLVYEFQESTKIECELKTNARDISLGHNVTTTIFRIFQQALNNVFHHSKATKVKIDLHKTERKVILRIQDNGKGISQREISSPRAFGLIGIRERTNYFGGKVIIEGVKNKGTTIEVMIPLIEKRGENDKNPDSR